MLRSLSGGFPCAGGEVAANPGKVTEEKHNCGSEEYNEVSG